MKDSFPDFVDLYGEIVPTFDYEWEAIAFYFDYRQTQLQELAKLCHFHNISLDASEESLYQLESLYFDAFAHQLFAEWQMPIEVFEAMMSVYLGEVVIRHHSDAEWVVQPYMDSSQQFTLGLRRNNKTWHSTQFCENLYLEKQASHPYVSLYQSLL
ncbi:hypothetical protein [Bacillus sp. NPDC077027]|uniref:hypothetical protein n=1 Tax=Bacillus sp. NPDC077027 TaxID=3390548 RepID=UPI003D091996